MSTASWLRFCVVALALCVAGAVNGPASAARADDLEKLDTSLTLIPADAAFYSSMLRGREQVEMFLQSNAIAKLKALPITQMGRQMFQMQAANPESEVAKALVVLKNPEVKKVIDLLADMFSNEVFIYGDKNTVGFIDLYLELYSTSAISPLLQKIEGEDENVRPNQAQARAVINTLLENLDKAVVPNMLMGFKLEKPAAANEALIKLEMFINIALSQAPPQFQGVLKRETLAGHEYLVLRLNGKMIPWEGNEVEKLVEAGIEEEQAQKLIDHAKDMDLVIALGVRENYLLASIGSTAACIEKLGTGERLINQAPLKRLEKYADRKLTSIAYASAELHQAVAFQPKDIDDLYTVLQEELPQTELGKEKVEQILRDARALADDLKGMIPEAGAEMAFSFLAEQGVETYDYKWGKQPQLDGSKRLSLLEHVGGNPLLGIVSRGKVSVKDYDIVTKWLSVGWKYFNEFAVPQMPPTEREKFDAYVKDAMPLLERLNKATRDSLLPALADGQSGLVIDGKFQSKRLQAKLPEWEKAMPLPELGLVMGVSDANLLKKAMSEYFAIASEMVEVIRKNEPTAIPPDFKLQPPIVTAASGYTIYGYALPSECGMDKNIIPNAGLSDKVAVLSLSLSHTERLMQKTPLAAGGVLAKTDRPLAVAVWFNWAGLLDTAMPWIDYGLDQIDEDQLGGDRQAAVDQIHVLLDVLKCYRSITMESYLEDGCLVSHSLVEIHDAGK